MGSHPSLLSASQRSNSIRLPAKGAVQLLATLFVVFLSLCLFPSVAVAQSPHAYVSPQVGPPTSQAEVVGNGFDPNATLDLYFDSTDVGLVVTDNEGSFGLALKAPTLRQSGGAILIPKDAVPGTHTITAVERITQLQAQVAFTVRSDWPQFQFEPDHTGLNPYENVLSTDNVGNLTLRWLGIGIGIPVVADGVLYVADFDVGFRALNADTGAPLWSQINQGFYYAAAVANGVVYFGSNDGYLYALKATSGALLWKRGDGSNSPIVANGVVYEVESCNVDALNADTGTLRWSYQTACHFGIGDAPTVANGVVYVGVDDGYLYALDAGTGALLWKFLGTQYYSFGSPAVTDGIVYAMDNAGIFYSLNANTGALIWKYATGYRNTLGSPQWWQTAWCMSKAALVTCML